MRGSSSPLTEVIECSAHTLNGYYNNIFPLSTIKTNSIDDSAITADKIADTTITGGKIANTTIDVTAKMEITKPTQSFLITTILVVGIFLGTKSLFDEKPA